MEFGVRMAVSVAIAGYFVAVLPSLLEASNATEVWDLVRPVAWLGLALAYLAARAR